MIKEEGQPKEGRKKMIMFSQRSSGPGAPGSGSRIQDLKAEARQLGWKYWVRVVIGFFVMIFLAASACNVYLQFKYDHVFQESPCNLCLDLNDLAASCLSNDETYLLRDTSWITIHPLRELGEKAAWLQIPCDVCGNLNPERKNCLDSLFHPDLNKTKNIFDSDFNPEPIS